MANYTQIGQDLYADNSGKYYNYANGAYNNVESPFDTMSNKINTMYDANRKNQLDMLRQQRDKAVAGFNQQKKDLAPQYQNQRNQVDVVNTQGATRARELMAANGINASGESLTTQANLASSRQNALSEINTNESHAIRQIDDQIANENDPAREQAIINAVEAERSGKLADAWQQAQAQQYQQMMDWRNSEFQRQQFEWQKQMEQQQLAAQRSASSRKSSGGSGGRSSSASPSAAPSGLEDAYNQYLQAKAEAQYMYDNKIPNPNSGVGMMYASMVVPKKSKKR